MKLFSKWVNAVKNSNKARSIVKECVLEGFNAGLTHQLKKEPGDSSKAGAGSRFTIEMIKHHILIDSFIAQLKDDESKNIITWLIKFRAALSIIGDKEVVLESYFPSQISKSAYEDLREQARRLPEAKLKSAIDVDLIENFLLGGYSLPGICEVEPGDTVLDLGVFNGNSTVDLARRAGDTGRIFGFEPNDYISGVARENLNTMGIKAEIITSAVGKEEGELRFQRGGAASRVAPNGDEVVPVDTIDNFASKRQLGKINFLKFDIEGHEVQALQGAETTIRKGKPKIAVCIYHRAHDLIKIPALISEYHRGYKFYVRHRARHDGEIILFCVP